MSTAKTDVQQQMWCQQPLTPPLGDFLGSSGTGTLWVCLLLPGEDKDKVRGTTGSGAEGALKTSTEDCQLSLSQSARRLWFSCHWTREPRSLWAAPFPWMFYILCIRIHTWNSSFLPQKNQVVSHKTQVVQAMIMQEILIISAFLLISSWLLQSHEHRCL